MRMTYTSLCNLWKCWHEHVMKHLSPWRNKRGATTTTTKMMPRQHSDDPITHWDIDAKVLIYGMCKRWWGDPGYRVPTGRRHGKQGGTCMKQTGMVQTYGSSQTTCIRTRAVVSSLYLWSVRFGANGFEVEVVAHGSSWEVVALAGLATLVVHVWRRSSHR